MAGLDWSQEAFQQIVQNNSFGGNARVHFGNNINSFPPDFFDGYSEAQKLERFKRAIYYGSIDKRRAQIASDQLETLCPEALEWIWRTDFAEWLASTNMLFWLSGKPGSGKSTLMNYIAHAEETTRRLPLRGREWIRCHFYFDFRAGTGVANTMDGLLRSFMLQLMNKCPEFEAKVQKMKDFPKDSNISIATDKLKNMISEALSNIDTPILALIDGLDEYQGHHFKLVQSLLALQSRSHMKVCFASRPENAINRLLQKLPKIIIQDHNHSAIRAYLRTQILALLTEEEVHMIQRIIGRLVEEANGVILWARFVVDELCIRFPRGASVFEIEAVLDDLPPDVEQMYDRVLHGIPPADAQESAVFLHLLITRQQLRGAIIETDIQQLVVLLVTILQEVDPQRSRILASLSPDRLKLRFFALLGGLIEMYPIPGVGGTEPRLIHKSFLTHLTKSQWLRSTLGSTFWQKYPSNVWIAASIQALGLVGSGYTGIQTLHRASSRGLAYATSPQARAEFLSNCVCETVRQNGWSKHFAQSFVSFLLYCIEDLPDLLEDNSVSNDQTKLAMACPLLAFHGSRLNRKYCACQRSLRDDQPDYFPLLYQNYELLYALSHGLFSYFEEIYPTQKDSMTATSKAQLLKITARPTRASREEGLNRARETLLEDEVPDPEHLLLFLNEDISQRPPRYVNRLLKQSRPGSTLARGKFLGYDREPLCLLAWWVSTYIDFNVRAALLRLKVLLDCGQRLDDPCEGEETLFHYFIAECCLSPTHPGHLEALLRAGVPLPAYFTDGTVMKKLFEDLRKAAWAAPSRESPDADRMGEYKSPENIRACIEMLKPYLKDGCLVALPPLDDDSE